MGGCLLVIKAEVHFNHIGIMHHHQQKPQEIRIDPGFIQMKKILCIYYPYMYDVEVEGKMSRETKGTSGPVKEGRDSQKRKL